MENFKKSSADVSLFEEAYWPSQMDICFSEKCNLNCKYCFVKKTSPAKISFSSAKKAVDIFLKFPPQSKTITFTTGEPFLYPKLFQKIVDYILKEAKEKKIDLRLITTTNGTLLNKRIIKFLRERMANNFILNISLDGKQKTNDAYRQFYSLEKSVFASSWENFKILSKENINVRVISTITPDCVGQIKENIEFLLGSGFKKIDLFPQMFTFWSDKALSELSEGIHWAVNFFNKNYKNGYDLRLLNRLWGKSHYAKILFASDSQFYLYEWVLPLLYKSRKKYIIGNLREGISLAKRQALFNMLNKKIIKKNNGKCLLCKYQNFCANPIPLYMWSIYHGKNFGKYFDNFCKIAKIFIDFSEKLKNKSETDKEKFEFL